jgi:hypothetical protein
MNDGAPPEKKGARQRCDSDEAREIKDQRFGDYLQSRFGASDYLGLLAERLSQGLLNRFHCSGCARLAIDPIGFNGRGQPLCANCADPEGRSS